MPRGETWELVSRFELPSFLLLVKTQLILSGRATICKMARSSNSDTSSRLLVTTAFTENQSATMGLVWGRPTRLATVMFVGFGNIGLMERLLISTLA